MEQLLTQLGTGEAAVTILAENGVPTPVVHTRLRPPFSRMGPTDGVDRSAKASPLYAKYGERKESESARELLAARMETRAQPSAAPPPKEEHKRASHAAHEGGNVLGDFLQSTTGRQAQREIIRGLFGLLKKSL